MFADLVNDEELREDVDEYLKKGKKIVLDKEGMNTKEETGSDEAIIGRTVVKDILAGNKDWNYKECFD